MNSQSEGRLIILSGPSCVGKSPLVRALARWHPRLHQRLQPLVLHVSRPPRPGEVDGVAYHFRTRAELEALREQPGFVVVEARGDLHGFNLLELCARLVQSPAVDVLFEGNPDVARVLQTHPDLAGVRRLSIFLSPLSRAELDALSDSERHADPAATVAELMRRKLLRRMARQQEHLSLPALAEVERRAGRAWAELQEARHFDYVLPNHDGEESENWELFPVPLGDARRTLTAVAALLEGAIPPEAEHWDGPWDGGG